MQKEETKKPEWVPQNNNEAFASFLTSSENKTEKNIIQKPQKSVSLSIEDYEKGILLSDRVILSRAITLIESNSAQHTEIAQNLIEKILPYTGKSIRIGITGSPGVGKSTFIEALGKYLTGQGNKVAVLAIDPSSTKSKGSILGDKTRMEELARDKNAFIRPSPSSGTLGGVARKTRETMLLCEAAGFNIIIIETVGVGQSEVTVRSMVDYFLVLLLPGAGDELQGIKKGIIELADGIIINKAEGDNFYKAQITQASYRNALHILSHYVPDFIPTVSIASAITNLGIIESWAEIEKFLQIVQQNNFFQKQRQKQLLDWFNSLLNEAIHLSLFSNLSIQSNIKQIQQDISELKINPVKAVNLILKDIFKN